MKAKALVATEGVSKEKTMEWLVHATLKNKNSSNEKNKKQ